VALCFPPSNFVTGTQTRFSFENLFAVLYPVFGLCREQAAAQRTGWYPEIIQPGTARPCGLGKQLLAGSCWLLALLLSSLRPTCVWGLPESPELPKSGNLKPKSKTIAPPTPGWLFTFGRKV
jgi:hypothetical protein